MSNGMCNSTEGKKGGKERTDEAHFCPIENSKMSRQDPERRLVNKVVNRSDSLKMLIGR